MRDGRSLSSYALLVLSNGFGIVVAANGWLVLFGMQGSPPKKARVQGGRIACSYWAEVQYMTASSSAKTSSSTAGGASPALRICLDRKSTDLICSTMMKPVTAAALGSST